MNEYCKISIVASILIFFRCDFIFFPLFFLSVKCGNAFVLILNTFFNSIGQQRKKEEKKT